MALSLNGIDQWLDATRNDTVAQPFTFAAWVSLTSTTYADPKTVICYGESDQEVSFNNLAILSGHDSYAVSFNNFAEIVGGALSSAGTYYHVAAVFTGSNILIYLNGTPSSVAWTPSSISYDLLSIGKTVSTSIGEHFPGYIEHAAAWRSALNASAITALYNQSVSPSDTDSSNLIAYLPLINSLTDEVGTLSWTAHGLSSPSYQTSGIAYPASYSYSGSGNITFSGAASTSSAATGSDYSYTGVGSISFSGESSTSLSLNDYSYTSVGEISFSGAATTSYPIDFVRIINHDNFECTTYTALQITNAASLKVYFEHASTGQDIVGNSDTDCSEGLNNDETDDCGLTKLYDLNSRYNCNRESFVSSNDYTWFSSNTGLESNMRGNPEPRTKLDNFVAMASSMTNAVDVVTFKFCWIDVWDGSGYDGTTDGYIADGTAFAGSMETAIEAFESANPGLIFVYFTMPLQSNASYPARQNFNEAIRTYCANNNKFLIDIADIECHDDDGVIQLDVNDREVMYSGYARADGGHLNAAGSVKMARAWWSLLANIALSLDTNIYSGSGSIAFSGSSESVQTSNFSYSGTGSIDLSGSSESIEYNEYAYSGSGQIEFSGEASTTIGNSFSYTGIGNIEFTGTSNAIEANDYSYSGIGNVNFSGESAFSESIDYLYYGSGSIDFAGISESNESNDYIYTSIGEISLLGNASTSYQEPGSYAYSGIGNITFSGTSEAIEYNNYSYTGVGDIVLSGTSDAIEANYYAYSGVGLIELNGSSSSNESDNYIYTSAGDIEFSGESATSYNEENSYTYISNGQIEFNGLGDYSTIYDYEFASSGEIIFGGASSYLISGVHGLMNMVFTSKKPSTSITSKKPSMVFSSKNGDD